VSVPPTEPLGGQPDHPACLVFRLDGFPSPPERIEWDGARLWRQRPDRERWARTAGSEAWEAVVAPKAEAWTALAQVLEDSGVWAWPRRSENLDVLDGTQWSLKLRWDTRRWSGEGSNAFPPGFGAVRQALEALAGGRRVPGSPKPFSFWGEWEGWIWDFTWDGRQLSGTWEQWREGRKWPHKTCCPRPCAWGPFRKALVAAQAADQTAGLTGTMHPARVSVDEPLRAVGGESMTEPWFQVARCLMDLLPPAPEFRNGTWREGV
jgi:hypothetical protein